MSNQIPEDCIPSEDERIIELAGGPDSLGRFEFTMYWIGYRLDLNDMGTRARTLAQCFKTTLDSHAQNYSIGKKYRIVDNRRYLPPTSCLSRPSEDIARFAIETFLREELGVEELPSYSLCEDGEYHWAFWLDKYDDEHQDSTSYLHANLKIEWLGTCWDPNTPEYE